MFKMRANRGCFICLSFLLLFCQLPKIDAKARNAESDSYCQWSEGECSRSCGGGVKKSTLTCLNNRSDGLSSKKELKFKYTSCNTQNCPDQRSYRALQCAMYNKKPVDGHYYKWKPFYSDGDDVCALVCAVNRTFHAKLADKVVDGTRCRPDGYDICVNGKCKSAGCDRKLGSNLVDDACRVCGGEGKDCKTVEGDYENENNKGYKDIITILKGATNIYIDEEGKTKNYFALRDVFAKFYLNSQWNLIEHKKFIAVGTMFHYQKDSNGQSLIALGPTTDALTLVLVGKGDPTKIHYEYYIPEKGHVSKPVAGQRMQRRRRRRPQNNVKTQTTKPDRPSREEQPQSRSSLSKIRADRDEKLQTRRRTARNYPLPSADTPLPSGDAPPTWDARRSVANYEWVHGMWTKCSATCGEGIQRRAVQCFSRQTRELSEGKCSEEDKPQSIQKCEMPCDSSFQWVEAGWTDCSQSCGGGEMSSISVCEEITKSGTKRVKEKYCEETLGPSPRQMKVCNEHQCQASPAKRAPPCWETLYGCCLDRRTAASGPDHAGCGESHAECQNTQHGCCPDGVTIARGERYAGCPSVPLERLPAASPTSAALTDSGHVCQMKMDTGNCGDYKIHWGYNVSTGRCEQFWYGGCGGNDNRFEDERACLMACRGTRTTRVRSRPTATSPREVPNSPREPSSSDVCQMKMDTGNCGDYKIHWGYNVSTGRCEQFWYGGCGGNDNRFEDERACLMACRGTRTTRVQPRPTATSPREVPNSPREPSSSVASETHTDDQVCELDADVGSCSDYVTKWFYNSTSAKCQQFWYGGCRGNDNKFDTERDCQMKCRGRRTSNCASLPFGCCEDGTTAARGPQRLGCPEGDCQRSRYGCCPDGTTPARGQEQEGCDTRDCRISKYGCCQDGRSFARGENYGGCPQPRCNESRYGCCPDGVSFAQGENYAGCRRINECERTEYGCCPDQRTTAQGPNGEGCCHYTEFGCCPDGLTVSGPNHEKCRTQDCRRSRYGCCRDGVNFARGENFKGCPSTDCRTSEAGCCPDGVTFVSEGCAPPDCHSTRYGCCPDGRTIARGYYQEGCREKDCRQSEYGCCPDGVSYAKGEEFLGCPTCRDTKYGCCPDGTTVAKGNDYLGCTLGSCHLSDYGCCPDMRTVAMGPEHLGCKEKDCRQYRYGCCEDGITYARGRNMDGCPKNVERCTLSRYGCCEDGRTEAQGPERYGCPETLCTYSEFGCCEDGVTFAKGREFEGCPGRQLRGCAGTRYGCCEDGRTAAQGPERYGCPETLCAYSEFGCCEDGVTFAKGREFEGCPERRLVGGCAGTRYGCCEDGRTAAQGPERYGCPETQCVLSEYGCCPDGRTSARGPDLEGCRRRDCRRSTYGCCPDGVSFARGPEYSGCEIDLGCEASPYGCCPDMSTAARGPDYAGCPPGGCRATRYGCCPDKVTSADGPNYAGCDLRSNCESPFGCCPDGITAARGPDYAGCVVPTKSTEVDCESDKDTGTCSEYVTKWYFNRNSSKCEQFWYGGCGGNHNRYDNERECNKKCRRRRASRKSKHSLKRRRHRKLN